MFEVKQWFSLRRLKMRSKLLALVALVACSSVAALTFFNYQTTRISTFQKQGTMMMSKGDEVLHVAEKVIQGSVDQMRALALSPRIIEAVEAANRDHAAQSSRAVPAIDRAWGNGDGEIDAFVQRLVANGVSQQLRSFQNTFPEQVEVFVTDEADSMWG